MSKEIDWGGAINPVGTIINYLGTIAPDGYLFCDGTEYNIADYPALANHFETNFGTKNFFGGDGTTTFKVPDLQGEFLRCTGTNSHAENGDGANVGMHQDATGVVNNDSYLNSNLLTYEKGQGGTSSVINGDGYSQKSTGYTAHARSNNGSDVRDLYSYVRPTNTSVWYCIKY